MDNAIKALNNAIAIAAADYQKLEGLTTVPLHVTNECTPDNYEYWEEDAEWFADGGCKVHPNTISNIQVHFDPEAPSLDDGEPQYSILIEDHGIVKHYSVCRITWGCEHMVEKISNFHLDVSGGIYHH